MIRSDAAFVFRGAVRLVLLSKRCVISVSRAWFWVPVMRGRVVTPVRWVAQSLNVCDVAQWAWSTLWSLPRRVGKYGSDCAFGILSPVFFRIRLVRRSLELVWHTTWPKRLLKLSIAWPGSVRFIAVRGKFSLIFWAMLEWFLFVAMALLRYTYRWAQSGPGTHWIFDHWSVTWRWNWSWP